jgi:hypothetical protein
MGPTLPGRVAWLSGRAPALPSEPGMAVCSFPTRKLMLFAVLSAADLALTCHLLGTGGTAVQESNPLAAWALEFLGWPGLAGFKGLSVTAAAGLVVLIFRRRPQAAHRLLRFACAAVAVVVFYSGYLCDAARRQAVGLEAAEVRPLLAESERLDENLRRARAYCEEMRVVVRDLGARQCTLEESVARLAETEQGRDGHWLDACRLIFPGLSDSECLAVSVLNNLARNAAGDPQLLSDMRAEFRALYGRVAPAPSGLLAVQADNVARTDFDTTSTPVVD